jgi:histidine triad (HIT) family protein
MMKLPASPFESILKGHEKDWTISQSQNFLAVLEKRPLVLGHVVVISKRVEDAVFDLTQAELSDLLPFSKPIAQAIKKVVPCRKIGIAVLGLETRHAHLHLVPISSADDLNFSRPKLEIKNQLLIETARQIREALADL